MGWNFLGQQRHAGQRSESEIEIYGIGLIPFGTSLEQPSPSQTKDRELLNRGWCLSGVVVVGVASALSGH